MDQQQDSPSSNCHHQSESQHQSSNSHDRSVANPNPNPIDAESPSESSHQVPSKRKFDHLLQDSPDHHSHSGSDSESAQRQRRASSSSSHPNPTSSHSQDRQTEAAQRAYIARNAPHLFQDSISNPSSPYSNSNGGYSNNSNRSPSRSPSQTPSELAGGIGGMSYEMSSMGNENESLIQDLIQGGAIGVEDNQSDQRGGIEGEGLGGSSEAVGGDRSAHDEDIDVNSTNTSKHRVPPNYRGPLPKPGDAEEIAPKPALIPIPGSKSLFNTRDHPLNRHNYRYTSAGPSSTELVQTVYKSLQIEPYGIHWSWSDRSGFTSISKEADMISTDKGFRSARSNIGVRNGKWLAEIEILGPDEDINLASGGGGGGENLKMLKDGPHVRLGWGRREAQLNAPVGFDAYSYGLRDKNGDKITMSRCCQYSNTFGPGDVIGIYISIPEQDSKTTKDSNYNKIRRKRLPIRYKGQLYFEQLEYAQSKEMESLMERVRKGNPGKPDDLAIYGNIQGTQGYELAQKEKEKEANKLGKKKNKNEKSKEVQLRPIPILKGSKIGFFINGKPQGIAFEDLFDFRPIPKLPETKSSNKGGHRSTHSSNSTLTKLPNLDGEETTAIITSSSSLAAIMKARENAFDDGELGYFPFVSCFGGARARLISGPEFKFDYPDDLDEALEKVDQEKAKLEKEKENNSSSSQKSIHSDDTIEMDFDNGKGKGKRISNQGRNWKPLNERYEEFKSEQWKYDLEDEERAHQRFLLNPNNQLPERQSSKSKSKSGSHKPSAPQKLKLDEMNSNSNSNSNSADGTSRIGSPSDVLLNSNGGLMNRNLTPEHHTRLDSNEIGSPQIFHQSLNPNLTPGNSGVGTPEEMREDLVNDQHQHQHPGQFEMDHHHHQDQRSRFNSNGFHNLLNDEQPDSNPEFNHNQSTRDVEMDLGSDDKKLRSSDWSERDGEFEEDGNEEGPEDVMMEG